MLMDLSVFSGALSSITGLIKVANETKNFDWTNKLIEVQQRIIELQNAYTTLQDLNRQLAEENRQLKEQKELESRLMFDNGVYWRAARVQDEISGEWITEISDEHPPSGPYCPSCWDLDRKLIRLQVWSSQKSSALDFYCPHHKSMHTFFDIPRSKVSGY
jgi:hypothetical protein